MREGNTRSRSHIIGIIALIFLIIGFQFAVFMYKSIRTTVLLGSKQNDTVYILIDSTRFYNNKNICSCKQVSYNKKTAKLLSKQLEVSKIKQDIKKTKPREYRSFPFNPNLASVDEFISLGFSKKQAESIDNYRKKGGKFMCKSDFKKSYVVSDSIYSRLEPYIDIPLVDLNLADSSQLVSIRGIGGFLSSRIIQHRERLGGFTTINQLLDIKYIDNDKLNSIKEYIVISSPFYFDLWASDEEQLLKHPYIGKKYVKSILMYIEHNDKSMYNWTCFRKSNIMSDEDYNRLEVCIRK